MRIGPGRGNGIVTQYELRDTNDDPAVTRWGVNQNKRGLRVNRFTAAGAQKLILERPGTLGILAALSGDKSTEPNQPGEWGWLRRSLALDDQAS